MTDYAINNRRTRILLAGLLLIGTIFVGRLFYLQIIRHGHYSALAATEHTTKFTLKAERGTVYAHDGDKIVPLVLNEPAFTAFADPYEVLEADKIESLMRRVAGGDLAEGFEEKLSDKKLRYVVLARDLNRKQAELIKKENIAGLGLQEGSKRVYPEGQLASQTLGFVDSEGAGRYGLEGFLDERIGGEDGVLKALTDVRQIPLSISNSDVRVPAKDGDDLVLNIDRNIQVYVEKALREGLERSNAKHGSVIVMDPDNGAVLAMANYPTFDPGKYNEVKDYSLFSNSVVSSPYEAGSVMKSLTMGVGLDTKVVAPGTVYENTGSVRVADFTINNATNDSIGPTSMLGVLQYSLNTGVVFVLKQLGGGEINNKGKQILYDYFTENYRLDQLTGIEQAGEVAGKVISPDSQEGGDVRYANMTFGQGMDTTMVEVASAFSSAINGGTYYKPKLVHGTRQADGSVSEQAPEIMKHGVLSSSSSTTLRDMLVEARHNGYVGRNDRQGYRLGGKTGTSQVIDPATGKYTDDNSIGTYLGFGGGATPEYVIMVRVIDSKLPGYSGTVAAAPIFSDIAHWMLDYNQIQPVN